METDHIFLTYQLKRALKANLYSKSFKSATKVLINDITCLYERSANFVEKFSLSKSEFDRKIKNNKKKKKSIGLNNSFHKLFFDQWAINGSLITQSVNRFWKSTKVFQNSLTFKKYIARNRNIFSIENISQNRTSTINFIIQSISNKTSLIQTQLKKDSVFVKNSIFFHENSKREMKFESGSFEKFESKQIDFFGSSVSISEDYQTLKKERAIANSPKTSSFSVPPVIPTYTPEVLQLIKNIQINFQTNPTSIDPQTDQKNPKICFGITLSETFSAENSKQKGTFLKPINLSANKERRNFPPESISAAPQLDTEMTRFALTSASSVINPKTSRIFQLDFLAQILKRQKNNKISHVQFAFFSVNPFEFLTTVISFLASVSVSSVSSHSMTSNRLFLGFQNSSIKKFLKNQFSFKHFWPESLSSQKISPFDFSKRIVELKNAFSAEIQKINSIFAFFSAEFQEIDPIFSNESLHISPRLKKKIISIFFIFFRTIPAPDMTDSTGNGPVSERGINAKIFSFRNLSSENIQGIAMNVFSLFTENMRNKVVFSIDVSKGQFKAIDVNFFDFKLDDSYDSENVVQVERNVYYRDVYLFVKRVKDIVSIHEDEKMKTNLFSCLKGNAQIWYTENLNDFEKKALRSLKKTDRWCFALIKKFKQFVISTLQALSSDKYTLDDVRNKRDISSFVFSIMRHAKTANISDVHGQFIWAFNAIASKLTRDIDLPEKKINVTVFFNQLKNKRETWYRIYNRKFNNFRNSSIGSKFFSVPSFFFKRREYENTHEFYEQNLFFQIVDRFQRLLFPASSNEKPNTNQTDSQNVENEKIRSIDDFSRNSNTAIPPWKNRLPLKEYNTGEKKRQNRREFRNKFKKTYREKYNPRQNRQEQEVYVAKKKKEKSKKYGSSTSKSYSYEKIDLEKKFDEKNSPDAYFYIITPDSPGVCKKCEIKKKIFTLK